MKSTICMLLVAPLATLAAFSSLPEAQDPSAGGETNLPGARPVIDAARFSTLQAAFDAVPETGGLVRLPAGVFDIHEPLVIRAGDTCVEGSGTATHIRNLNTTGEPALVLEHPDGARDRKTELWRIKLTNFRITGNSASGHGIDAQRINELFIDGVTVSEHGGDGIRLHYCYEDARLCDSLVTYNSGTGINLIGCHDIVVSSNQLEENQDALHCFDGFNLTMTGNALDDHLGHGVVIENTYGSVLTGNMIEECQGSAVVLDRDCYGITISANVVAHNGGGVDLRDAHGCAVSANTFTLMKTNALRISPDSGRIAVSANSFCDSYIGQDQQRRVVGDRQAGGLELSGARDVGISGNVFSGLRPKALSLSGDKPATGVMVTANVLVDAPNDLEELSDTTGCWVGENLTNNEPSISSD